MELLMFVKEIATMLATEEQQALVARLEARYMTDTLIELAKIPTEVPLGAQVFMEPDDPKLVHYVQQVLRPKLYALGAYDVMDVPRNQLVVRYGDGTTTASLLVLVYTPTQHHNLMPEPFSGKIALGTAWGYDEPCVYGQGVTQNKAHHAVMLGVLKLLTEQRVRLRGTLYMAVNNEGRSSHACSEAILAALQRRPDFAILLMRTDMRLSLGNRGRVDVNVEVRGKAVHASTPQHGLSAIDGAYEVISRLKRAPLAGSHPLLGGRHAIAYQVLFEPLAPHTLPAVARLRVDRRLLPGDDPEQAVAEVRETIGDLSPYQVRVTQGPHMLPALVDPHHPGVLALKAAHRQVRGAELETYYGQGSFDAGGPCAAGVPAVMYGVGGGEQPVGVDFVPLSHVLDEARVLTHTILSLLG
jgi:acetylornithine deacetylase/succinyl-diaminopimelate desuccinylase-like protein